jgi:hypothetical protein
VVTARQWRPTHPIPAAAPFPCISRATHREVVIEHPLARVVARRRHRAPLRGHLGIRDVKIHNESDEDKIDRLERQVRQLYFVVVVMLLLNVVFLLAVLRMR